MIWEYSISVLWKRARVGFFLLSLCTVSTFTDPGLRTGILLGGSKVNCVACSAKRYESMASLVSPFQGALQTVSVQLRFLKPNAGDAFGVIYRLSAARVPSQVWSRLCTTLFSWWVAVPPFPGIQKITQNIPFLLPPPPLCWCQSNVHIVHFASNQHLQLTMPLFKLTTQLSFR